MTVITIESEIRTLLSKATGYDVEELRSDADLTETLGLDSLDRLTLAADLEDHFDIQLPDEQLAQLHTLVDIAGAVEVARGGAVS